MSGAGRQSAWGLLALAAATLIFGIVALRRPVGFQPASTNDLPATNPAPPAPLVPSAAASAAAAVSNQLRRLSLDLRAGLAPAEARRRLAALRARLRILPPAEAARLIRGQLDREDDVPTGLAFAVDPGGWLAGAPTWRVFLLDLLEQVDPGGAAVAAREILARKESPEEWALALRSCARAAGSAGERDFVVAKFREMIGHAPWRENPSAGFLEAFDVAVHLGGTTLLPELTGLVRDKANAPVSHAAYLALDRLTLKDTGPVLAELVREPRLMEGREETRANYVARADVRDPVQRELVEAYLLDPGRSPRELDVFARLFPNGNFTIAPGLATPPFIPDRATQAAQDRAALATVRQWASEPRFAALSPQLERIERRLEEFTSSRQGR